MTRYCGNRSSCLLLIGLLVLGTSCRSTVNTDEEKSAVRQVFETYLQSVRSADVSLASQVWSDSADVDVVTPLGRFHGWPSVRDNVYVKFLKDSFRERNLQASNEAIQVAGDTAWVVFDWAFNGTMTDGNPMSSNGWESHVYRKIDGRWRIVHLHYSGQLPPPPPAPGKS